MKRQGAAVAILLLALHFGSKRIHRIGGAVDQTFSMRSRNSKIEGAMFSTDGVREGRDQRGPTLVGAVAFDCGGVARAP